MVDLPGEDLIAWYAGVQKRFAIEPYVRIERPDADLNQTAFTDGAREVFFFANSSPERTIDTIAEFAIGARTPWEWNPETGGAPALSVGRSREPASHLSWARPPRSCSSSSLK